MSVETTQVQTIAATFYVFRSHGVKTHADSWKDPAGAAQLRAHEFLEQWLTTRSDGKAVKVPLLHEYSRRIVGLASLPKLQATLDVHASCGGRIVIDDLRRLFARCRVEDRPRFLEELERYDRVLHDMSANAFLSDISPGRRLLLLTWSGPVRTRFSKPLISPLTKEERKDQTRSATQTSSAARRNASHKAAMQLQKIRGDLEASGSQVTLKAIADAANEKGLRTARGTPWSESTVSRALKRLGNLPGQPAGEAERSA